MNIINKSTEENINYNFTSSPTGYGHRNIVLDIKYLDVTKRFQASTNDMEFFDKVIGNLIENDASTSEFNKAYFNKFYNDKFEHQVSPFIKELNDKYENAISDAINTSDNLDDNIDFSDKEILSEYNHPIEKYSDFKQNITEDEAIVQVNVSKSSNNYISDFHKRAQQIMEKENEKNNQKDINL